MTKRLILSLAALAATAAHAPSLGQEQTVGLFQHDEGSFEGYTLFAPSQSQTTYLIDNEGREVHSWTSGFRPGQSAYLLETGNLLRTARIGSPFFNAGGAGGRVEEYDWDGTLLWWFEYSNVQHRSHHDIEALPNGNVLMIAWEYKSGAEAIAAGRDPGLLRDGELWPDHIIEVEPSGTSGGTIVWEWHVWDHLIQDFDPTKANFGVVADHPELIDLNYDTFGGGERGKADWTHVNAIDYHEPFDQIILSLPGFNEIWVIDHSTTTAEAAGHTGGNYGKGGDLLYRWGNPAAYDRGTTADQKLFRQHDSSWIPSCCPGNGNILVFNNGSTRPTPYSTVDEIVPPVDGSGNYPALPPGVPYGPADPVWSYSADPPTDFFARRVSGAQRQPNGNTLICDGPQGTFFEVMPDKQTVWKYVNPVTDTGPLMQGDPIPVGPQGQTNSVFRAYRYPPDYPGLLGKDLTPGDPIEQFTSPIPAPDGSTGTAPMTALRLTVAGDQIQVDWDVTSCSSQDYNIVFGDLADVATYSLLGGECSLGPDGTHLWTGVPAGDLFFLVVGVDETSTYESSWGMDGTGAERNGADDSGECGVNYKDTSATCP